MLKIGESYAFLVAVSNSTEERWFEGVLVTPPNNGIAALKMGCKKMLIPVGLLLRVARSAGNASVGDVLFQHDRGVVVKDEETLLWLQAEEEGLVKELDHRRKMELARTRAPKRAE